MSQPCRPVSVEILEHRRYAASAEKVASVVNDPVRSSNVLQFSATEKADVSRLPRVKVFVDKSRTVNVKGTPGDDSVRVRVIKDGLEIRTTTRQTYRYYAADGVTPVEATAVIENAHVIARKDYDTLAIFGGSGSDSLRYAGGLSFNPLIASVEHESQQAYKRAHAGRTPSDAARRDGLGWLGRVKAERRRADGTTADVAFFGDSHVAGFLTTGLVGWNGYFKNAANFGIGGDDTRAALFRIQGGLFDKYKPKKLVVSIGTNNFNDPQTGGTDNQIYDGLLKVMHELRERLPDTRIVLISLLDRNGAGLRDRVKTLNARLADTRFSDFQFLNLYDRFSVYGHQMRQVQGVDREFAFVGDDSHYTKQGYRALAYYIDRKLRSPLRT